MDCRRGAQRDAAGRHGGRAARDRRRQQLPVQRGGLRHAGLALQGFSPQVRPLLVPALAEHQAAFALGITFTVWSQFM